MQKPPLTFAEGLDFYLDALDELASPETASMDEKMRGYLEQFAAELNKELEKTADTRGVGDKYREAVIEYKKMAKFGRAKLRWLRRPRELKRFWALIVSIFS